MRRALPALLAVVLLTACGSADPAGEQDVSSPTSPAPAATPDTGDAPEPQAAPDIDGLVQVPVEERDHRTGPLAYDTLPPAGGPHNAQWLSCDVYDEPVPDEFAVHALEHGAVWFTHAPDLPAGERAQLAALAERNREYVLVSPYEGLDSRIVAVAWGFTLEASSADDPRLGEFLEAFAGGAQGGEPGAPCRAGGLTPREARGQLGSAA